MTLFVAKRRLLFRGWKGLENTSGGVYDARTHSRQRISTSSYSWRMWTMDDRRFDSLSRALASTHNRRDLLKRVLGMGAGAAAVVALPRHATEAARRGFSGPTFPTETPCLRDAHGVCCASGVLDSGRICCTNSMTDGLGYCCDPYSGVAWTGCCCMPPPPDGGIQVCVC